MIIQVPIWTPNYSVYWPVPLNGRYDVKILRVAYFGIPVGTVPIEIRSSLFNTLGSSGCFTFSTGSDNYFDDFKLEDVMVNGVLDIQLSGHGGEGNLPNDYDGLVITFDFKKVSDLA